MFFATFAVVGAVVGTPHCNPGYTQANGSCVACAAGTFKAFAGNGACTACPVGTGGATADRRSCTCSSVTPASPGRRLVSSRRLLSAAADQDVWGEDADVDFEDFDADLTRMLKDEAGLVGSGSRVGVPRLLWAAAAAWCQRQARPARP